MMLPFHALGPCIHKGAQRMIGPKRKEMLFHVTQPLLARISNITVNVRVSPPIKHKDAVRHQSRNPSGLFERRRLGRGSSMQFLRRWEQPIWGKRWHEIGASRGCISQTQFLRKEVCGVTSHNRSSIHIDRPGSGAPTGWTTPPSLEHTRQFNHRSKRQVSTSWTLVTPRKPTATTPGKVTIAKHVRKPRALLLVFI